MVGCGLILAVQKLLMFPHNHTEFTENGKKRRKYPVKKKEKKREKKIYSKEQFSR